MSAADPLRPAPVPADAQLSAPVSAPGGVGRRQPRWRATPDWPTIEREYVSGGYSLRELAERHQCARSTIANKAGRDGWRRNVGVTTDDGCGAGGRVRSCCPDVPRRHLPAAEGSNP